METVSALRVKLFLAGVAGLGAYFIANDWRVYLMVFVMLWANNWSYAIRKELDNER